MAEAASHEFRCKLTWAGGASGTAFDYGSFSRDLALEVQGKAPITASAAPGYKGDPSKHNPEDLLMASLAACHALTYLAICSLSKVKVLAYEDEISGTLEKSGEVMKFTHATLRPRVTIASIDDESRALSLHEKAHQQCFIMNSVNFPVAVEARIVVAG